MTSAWSHKVIQIAKTLQTLRAPVNKLVLVFNYHRIGKIDPGNPFHKLHSVSPSTFKQQIKLLKKIAPFVSLDDIRDYQKLKTLNIALSFDDVSHTVCEVSPWLRSQKIPYTLAPCTQITEQGMGSRDQVYFILKLLPVETIFEQCQAVFPEFCPSRSEFSFYSFSKSNDISPFEMYNKVVQPLFESIPDIKRAPFLKEPAYMSWLELKEEASYEPYVTLANHSHQHVKMGQLSQEELEHDIECSLQGFERNLGRQPHYYAVPFGGISQSLVFDLNQILHSKNYKGILWVDGGSNLIRHSIQHQMLHLSRIHTPTNFQMFFRSLIEAFNRVFHSILDYVPEESHKRPVKVESSSTMSPALSVESLLRPGRDYSANPEFFQYAYLDNPYQQQIPAYHVAKSENRIEGICYNFLYPFHAKSHPYTINYWANWRSLGQSNPIGQTFLFFAAREHTPITGSYRPTDALKKAYQHWLPITAKRHKIPVSLPATLNFGEETSPLQGQLQSFSECPDCIERLCEEANQKNDFSIQRSPSFYKWRFDQYPLAQVTYWVCFEQETPKAYLVTLSKPGQLSISDFFAPELSYFQEMLKAAIAEQVGTQLVLHVESSSKDINGWLESVFDTPSYEFQNFYFIDPQHPSLNEEQKQQLIKVKEEWSNLRFHETQACGDVLLK